MNHGRNSLRWQGQMVRFLLVGVANTMVGLGTIWSLIGLAGWDDLPANAAGYIVGLTCSFLLNRRWTFAHTGAWWQALWRFMVVFGVAYTANLAAMIALRDGLHLDRYMSHALATVPYTLLFFLGSRLFAFRPSVTASDRSAATVARP